jgi:hypothetical protein
MTSTRTPCDDVSVPTSGIHGGTAKSSSLIADLAQMFEQQEAKINQLEALNGKCLCVELLCCPLFGWSVLAGRI